MKLRYFILLFVLACGMLFACPYPELPPFDDPDEEIEDVEIPFASEDDIADIFDNIFTYIHVPADGGGGGLE